MIILCIGSSLLEKTCEIDGTVKEGETKRLDNRIECAGGHAGNIAYMLSKWGIETYIASMLGSDDSANKIKKEFEMIGTKIDYIETSYDKPTSESLVIVNKISKNKTVFELMSNSFLKKYSFGVNADIVVSDGNDFNASVSAFDKYQKSKKFLSVTRIDKEMIELCKFADYLIFNKNSAEVYTNIQIDYNNSGSLVNLYNRLKQKFGHAEIVVTLGERGCLYAVNNEVKIMPSIRVGIVDTNGAGDVFVGGFVYGIARNFDLEKAITYASISASLSTTKLTSRLSIPTLTEVSNYYDTKFGKEVTAQVQAPTNGGVTQVAGTNQIPNNVNNANINQTQMPNMNVNPNNMPNPNAVNMNTNPVQNPNMGANNNGNTQNS